MTHDGTVGGFLDQVYELGQADETKQLYADWADRYDEEVTENGYVSPVRCAEALLARGADPASPLLDLGCGTGLSGEAFREAGFEVVDGTDFSPEMLEIAREKGVYRDLFLGDHESPLPEGYPAIAAVGLFSPAHAPASLIDAVVAALPSGGRFVFTLNDHALEDRNYEGRIREVCDTGAAHCLHRERGPHLPKIGLESTVYILGKP